MTLEQLITMPKGIKLEKYEELLKEKARLEKQIRTVSNKIYEEEDSLEVLNDEVESERYNKHLKVKQKAETKRDKLLVKLREIELQLK